MKPFRVLRSRNPGVAAPSTSFSNLGATGFRLGNVYVTATVASGSGSLEALIDGSFANSYSLINGVVGDGSKYIQFDFGLPKRITAFKWYQSTGHSHGTWRFEGSNDASAWTQVGADFTLVGSATPTNSGNGLFAFTNTSLYRYYRLRHMSGTTVSNPFITEVEFEISTYTVPATAYANAGGSGNRTGSIAITNTGIIEGGSAGAMVDGSFAGTAWWTGGTGDGSKYLTFNFGSDKIINAFKFYLSSANQMGVWLWEGSPDNAVWTAVSTQFPLYGATTEYFFNNYISYRYYRLRHMSGVRSNSPFVNELEFKIA